jgi:hypothetical protein
VGPESVRWVGGTLPDVLRDGKLLAQRRTGLGKSSLLEFRGLDASSQVPHLRRRGLGDEHDAIVVRHGHIRGCEPMAAEHGSNQGVRVPWPCGDGAEGEGAPAPDRKPKLAQGRGVAVATVDDDSHHTVMLGLQRRQVSDAPLVQPSAVVDAQDGAGRSPRQRFEEDVHGTGMAHRQHRPRDASALQHWDQAGDGTCLDLEADASVGDGSGGQGVHGAGMDSWTLMAGLHQCG